MSEQESKVQEEQTQEAAQFILTLAASPNAVPLVVQALNSHGITREVTSLKRQEQITISMLHQLPIALTITRREDNRYTWQWLEAGGQAASFLEALDEALTHIEVAYIASNELS